MGWRWGIVLLMAAASYFYFGIHMNTFSFLAEQIGKFLKAKTTKNSSETARRSSALYTLPTEYGVWMLADDKQLFLTLDNHDADPPQDDANC